MKAERDVFISYASEDRDAVAKPLAQLLTAFGISVWFDQFDLKIGDSLRRKIDEGINMCRYGIVILSSAFFDKHYTKLELDGLAQKEVNGEKVILPVWVGIDEKQIRPFSPSLADRIAGVWDEGMDTVAIKLVQVIKPEKIEAIQKRLTILPRLVTGKEIADIISGCHFFSPFNDDPRDDIEINLVGGFLQELQEWGDILEEIDIPARMKTIIHFSEMIDELKAAGWSIYGCKVKKKLKMGGVEDIWTYGTIAVMRGQPKGMVLYGDGVFVFKPEMSPMI